VWKSQEQIRKGKCYAGVWGGAFAWEADCPEKNLETCQGACVRKIEGRGWAREKLGRGIVGTDEGKERYLGQKKKGHSGGKV